MKFTRTIALTAGSAVLVTPLALVAAGPAAADGPERQGACGAGTYTFSVDPDDGRQETHADLDNVGPRTTWRVTLRRDGVKIAQRKIRADVEGDLELDRTRPNAPGKDRWTFRARQIGTGTTCSASITVA